MKIHELKIQLPYFEAVYTGLKTFEFRKDDRGFEVGDLIRFRVLGKTMLGADNSVLSDVLFKIKYILRDIPELGLPKDYCILGIVRMEMKEYEPTKTNRRNVR